VAPAAKAGFERAAWSVACLVFVALAVGAPVQMARAQANKNTAGKASGSSAPSAGTTGTATVKMVSLSFQPGELAVRKGTEVVFENDDVAPHTVTAVGGKIDSGTLAPRKVFKLVVNDPFEYVCLIHPNMKGKVVLSG
jgi:plastocyanin